MPRPAARGEQGRAAHRPLLLLVERLLEQGVRAARHRGAAPRQEPQFGHRFDRDDPHPPGPAALAFRDAVNLGEDALNFLQVGLAAAVEAQPGRRRSNSGMSRRRA